MVRRLYLSNEVPFSGLTAKITVSGTTTFVWSNGHQADLSFVTAMGQSVRAMTPFNWYVRDHNGSYHCAQ